MIRSEAMQVQTRIVTSRAGWNQGKYWSIDRGLKHPRRQGCFARQFSSLCCSCAIGHHFSVSCIFAIFAVEGCIGLPSPRSEDDLIGMRRFDRDEELNLQKVTGCTRSTPFFRPPGKVRSVVNSPAPVAKWRMVLLVPASQLWLEAICKSKRDSMPCINASWLGTLRLY